MTGTTQIFDKTSQWDISHRQSNLHFGISDRFKHRESNILSSINATRYFLKLLNQFLCGLRLNVDFRSF